MRSLSVNLDHIATLRQARGTNYPSVATAAGICELAGADGITLHLREDRRHIQDKDVQLIGQVSLLPITLEMAPTDEMVKIAIQNKPYSVTLVPERRMEVTTEGGIDAISESARLTPKIQRLQQAGILTCLFLEPTTEQIQKACELEVDAVELHTGLYSEYFDRSRNHSAELKRIEKAVELGKSMDLKMNAGHGLHYQNVRPIAAISGLDEFSIGHSIISRSIFVGLERAIAEMVSLVKLS
ncbi:MAG: pyridoxine 5'-phosphate synthase [Leptonema sp. (in: Bacteria)]|nr:pyridoxine 5'-phosphate synthase [Leptonema sp. (in: bacteria)]